MSTYENLHGRRVNVVSSNPSNPGDGEVWYNSTLGQLKGQVLGTAAWSSGGNLNTGASSNAGFGIQTAAITAGGGTRSAQSEEYDGSSWTSLPTMRSPAPPAFIFGGCGTTTAGVTAGGMPGGSGQVATTDEYDGSSWTGGGNMNTARQGPRLFGTLTAAVVTGGRDDPGAAKTSIELYNGTAWTASPLSMSTSRDGHMCAGTYTAGLAAGGNPNRNQTEEYDGEGWTSGGNLPTSWSHASSGGTQTSALIAGGYNPSTTNNAVQYDGTSWSAISNMATTISDLAGSSNTPTNNSFVAFGGARSGVPNATNTEEFAGAVVETKTLTTG
tara:strand:+ start:591 stop:1574 length:984 start_codon:yes stop_codon:yes gene_type:complete